MSVDIEPVELSFRRPFTAEVTQILKIKNPNPSPVVFKVKTTAPKQYCVRPNAGRIEPGQDFDVSVLLQAMKADPPADAKCRDKFLVQSARITPDMEFASIAAVLETTDKANVFERKIRVNWLPANDGSEHVAQTTPSKPQAVNGANHSPDATRRYGSPPGTADSTTRPPPPYSDSKEDDDTKSETVRSAVSRPSTAVSNPANIQSEELRSKIAHLESELANYKDSGLRQRTAKSGEAESRPSAAAAAVAQREKQTVEGVPVQVAAILCLLSFLLGYLFF
ncbi:Uncharacterized protein ESCO_003459 [Escovopsis weberi]|uniref:MSP domain-containing protein n=1 Tax=Escovopsis weberi TaxID=150374 RepID=A0A0M9VXQ1_ESCWE|nr:Uncharacterized protein ESCO_003459 [Escovopsis weberi]